jgi:hypothetical protein
MSKILATSYWNTKWKKNNNDTALLNIAGKMNQLLEEWNKMTTHVNNAVLKNIGYTVCLALRVNLILLWYKKNVGLLR